MSTRFRWRKRKNFWPETPVRVVIEHPDYNNKDMPPIERLIAICAGSIAESGKIVWSASA